MKKTIYLLLYCLCLAIQSHAQLTTLKNDKEFFNGDDRHLYAYLNNNYHDLDPIEGIWMFTRIDYNEWGVEVSRTPNEFKVAIVRDKGNMRRAFVEVNLSRMMCKPYQITYSIQSAGGSGTYPLEPQGCSSAAGHYIFHPQYNTISRPGISLAASTAVLVGVRIFPQGPPTELLPMPGGTVAEQGQATSRLARTIIHPSGWEPYIDWGKNIFPAYLLSMGTLDPKLFPVSDDYLGDPLSVVGLLINATKNNTVVQIEIEPTAYSRAVSETFTLDRKNRQYAIFPKMIWDYEKLRAVGQAKPLNFVFQVTTNGKTVTQSTTANLRALDDCPLSSFDYKGDPIDLKFLAAAYVNEGHPQIKEFTKEIRKKGLIRDFSGIKEGDVPTVQQVYAFWKILRDKGISYSSITNNGQENKEVNSQRIRLLEDIVDETQANCIDGTALLSSCLEAVSIPSVLIFIPNHAFLGYFTLDEQGKTKTLFFLETTMLGSELSSVPKEATQLLEQEPYVTMRKALYEQFNGGKTTKNPELEHFICASLIAEYKYKKAVRETPERVQLVTVSKYRKLVKPIYRNEHPTYIPYEGSLSQRPVKPTVIKPTTPTPVVPANPSGTISHQAPPTLMPAAPTLPTHRGTESYDLSEFKTDAPEQQGGYFKVQVTITFDYQAEKPTYLTLKQFGRIDVERMLPDLKKTRVMIGSFASHKAAIPAAKKAQSLGFNTVAIVRYQNGNRHESIYRDWKLITD